MATASFTLAQKIRALKIGAFFMVYSKKDREKACREAKTLRSAGVIVTQVVTRAAKDKDGRSGYKIVAIP